MASRDQILAKVRRSLGASAADAPRRAAVADRLMRAPKTVIPARGQLAPADRVALFCDKAAAVFAGVEHLADAADLPAAVAAYLRANNLPQAIRTGDDERLAGLDWASQPQLALSLGPSRGDDLACLSFADAGVAETGTLVLTSGSHNPTTLNFLPDHHLVAIDAASVVGDYEAVWSLLRDRFGAGALPRTVNMITGPSRSADIEQTLLLGAHGPRSLHILVIGAGS